VNTALLAAASSFTIRLPLIDVNPVVNIPEDERFRALEEDPIAIRGDVRDSGKCRNRRQQMEGGWGVRLEFGICGGRGTGWVAGKAVQLPT
jgi:hypothetical protein